MRVVCGLSDSVSHNWPTTLSSSGDDDDGADGFSRSRGRLAIEVMELANYCTG